MRIPTHPGTDQATSRRMARMPRAGTGPEKEVRKIIRELGVRYRLNSKTLPGKPDIASKSRKLAIFVHGCFWHGHTSCGNFSLPKANRLWWQTKIRENRARDDRKSAELVSQGFRVVTVWECELKKPARLKKKLSAIFDL